MDLLAKQGIWPLLMGVFLSAYELQVEAGIPPAAVRLEMYVYKERTGRDPGPHRGGGYLRATQAALPHKPVQSDHPPRRARQDLHTGLLA